MRRRLKRLALVPLALGLAGSMGCTHHHYYYAQPGAVGVPAGVVTQPCPPGTTQGVTTISTAPVVGSVCDDPAVKGGTVVTTVPPNGQPVYTYSYPSNPFKRGFGWKSAQPQNVATLKVEGAYTPDGTETR